MLYEISKANAKAGLELLTFRFDSAFFLKSRPVWPVFISLVTTSDRTPPTSQNHPYLPLIPQVYHAHRIL
jgi:hypothetical protein